MLPCKKLTTASAISLAVILVATISASSQTMTNVERGRAEIMLEQVRSTVEKHYYDKNFHGLNLNARYEQYKQGIERSRTMLDALRVIAAFTAGLKDSHTFLEPPSLVEREDYGYVLEMIGDRCFIVNVRPGTDAAKKLHPGDEVLGLNRYTVNRQDLWQLWYALNQLQPVTATLLRLRTPDAQVQEQLVQATPYIGKRIADLTFDNADTDFWNIILDEEQHIHDLRQRYAQVGDVLIWKMPAFLMSDSDLGRMTGMVRAHKAVILDLRGNPGGSVEVLEKLAGSLFDHEVQIAQRVGRKAMKPIISKKSGQPFNGKLIVLVDSQSASAAELFARIMQLNHRALIMGDRSSGSVMEARYYPLRQGSDTLIFYGVSVTDANLIMADGQSLENNGVTPDEVVLPTPADLAAGRDPVLAEAAEKLGAKLDPKAAGALFPFEWTPLRVQ